MGRVLLFGFLISSTLPNLVSKVESKGWTGWDVLASVAPRHCAANGTLGEQESVAH